MSNEATMIGRGSVWGVGSWLLLAACSGRVGVGVEPADEPKVSAGTGGSGSSSSGGGRAGAAQVGGSTMGEPPDACAFEPDQLAPDSRPLLSSSEVLARIFQFLENDPQIPDGALPEQPTPAWAAARAKGILDNHHATGTPAPGLVRFLDAWLDLEHRARPPESDISSRWSMRLGAPDATLATLLLDPLDEPQRIGIVNEAELLSAYPTISGRGTWMSDRLLCQPVPPPPENIGLHDGPRPAVDGLTQREQLEAEVAGSPACRGCHILLDPLGFSLEHFDELGAYRQIDNGKPVNAAATLYSPPLAFTDYSELAPQLATSCEVARCFATRVWREARGEPYLWGPEPSPAEQAEINRILRDFVESDYSIRTLVSSIVRSPSFLR